MLGSTSEPWGEGLEWPHSRLAMTGSRSIILSFLWATLVLLGLQSCAWTYDASREEKQIVRDIYEETCGIKDYDPCHLDDKWPVCGPGESDMCQVPTCTGGQVRLLTLSCNQLSEVPGAIGGLTGLEHLRISSMQPFILPVEIKQLTNLETLDLSGNQLESVPTEIGQIPNLKTLRLDRNQITGLPPEIGELENLERLDLSGNFLTSLPGQVGQLSRLKILSLSENRLTTLPPEIGGLTDLQELDLSANQLNSLPVEIGYLSNLRVLYLDENQLDKLPYEIGQLASLETLNIADNHINDLPHEMGQLKRLTRLDLDRNPLSGPMPTFLVDLPLEHFGYSITGLCIPESETFQGWPFGGYWVCSQATQLPEAERFALTSLYMQIGLDESWHPQVPPCRWKGVNCWNGHARNIQLLNWTSHELTQLPLELTQLSQLEALALDSNQLEELPPEFELLETLKRLTLNNNQFTSIPPEIGRLHRLEYLDLSANPLSGPIPEFVIELPLLFFYFEGTDLCLTGYDRAGSWLDGLVEHSEGTSCFP